MKVTLSDSVHRLQHTVEVPTPWAELNAALEKYASVKTKLETAFTDGQAKTAASDQAKADYQADLAIFVIDGGRKPTDAKAIEAAQEAERASQLVEATRTALADAYGRVVALIEEHREDWVGDVAVMEQDATDAYSAAIDSLVAARGRLNEVRGQIGFMRDFPRPKAGIQGAGLNFVISRGNWVPWQTIETALKRDAGVAPAEPYTLGQHVVAAGLTPAPGVAV